ncbi:Uncharacterised protein [Amycolatopsis camponoti]|uniref:Uncharacterized protein n=1 Tax=Amycolatopsis camponoti TaxID=2606593 RepID=A0A6I8M3U2_9PSEU|nr:Uncharacterised protein [Amycolatopsis camponoti]
MLTRALRTARRLFAGPLGAAFVAGRPLGRSTAARVAPGRCATLCRITAGSARSLFSGPGGAGVFSRPRARLGTARCIWLLAGPGAVAVVVHEWASQTGAR